VFIQIMASVLLSAYESTYFKYCSNVQLSFVTPVDTTPAARTITGPFQSLCEPSGLCPVVSSSFAFLLLKTCCCNQSGEQVFWGRGSRTLPLEASYKFVVVTVYYSTDTILPGPSLSTVAFKRYRETEAPSSRRREGELFSSPLLVSLWVEYRSR
jgi:hypothetical protein